MENAKALEACLTPPIFQKGKHGAGLPGVFGAQQKLEGQECCPGVPCGGDSVSGSGR